MYGFGYASGEDRLWLYDLLRNLGRGRLSSFLGPASAFYSYDSNLATVAGYSEDELSQMVSDLPTRMGPIGTLIVADIGADVAGINAYIDSLSGANPAKKPPEYATLKGGGFPPPHFTAGDIVASAILIQSIFAGGGGSEPMNELLLQELDPDDRRYVPPVAGEARRELPARPARRRGDLGPGKLPDPGRVQHCSGPDD